jgi:hypothetical protein
VGKELSTPRPVSVPEFSVSTRWLLAVVVWVLVGVTLPACSSSAQELEAPDVLPPPSSPLSDDPNEDADQGQPQARPQAPAPTGTVFPSLQFPGRDDLAEFRRSIYEKYGFTFGASYQQLFQSTSATARTATNDTALGGWAAVSTTWTALDRGGPYEGTLVVRGAFRGSLGDNTVPAVFGLRDIGSLWSNYEWTSWNQGFRIEDLFWEQKIGSQFSFRVGNQGPQAVFNFFRFKDARTGFTASPAAFNETIPYPTFGLGASFRLWPIVTDPGVYVVGTLNDMNGDPAANGLDWSTFGKRQYFYGVELGKDWRRDNGEFDHLHLDLFYADRRSTRNPDTSPNVAGGGFKLAGEKQIGQIVAFANYVYNTAQGGGISTTVSRHTAIAGVAYLRPFDIQGEVAVSTMWARSFANLIPGVDARNQYGVETYWTIGVTPNSSLTPGIQLIFNPALNPSRDFVAVPHMKFRVFF